MTTAPVPRIALTVPEAARSLGTSPSTVRRWVRDELLGTVPHTGRTLIAVAELQRFANTNTKGTTS